MCCGGGFEESELQSEHNMSKGPVAGGRPHIQEAGLARLEQGQQQEPGEIFQWQAEMVKGHSRRALKSRVKTLALFLRAARDL